MSESLEDGSRDVWSKFVMILNNKVSRIHSQTGTYRVYTTRVAKCSADIQIYK